MIPTPARSITNIGLCYYYLNRPEEAIKNYEEAIRINELSYGERHETTAYLYNNLGAAYSEADKLEEAIAQA